MIKVVNERDMLPIVRNPLANWEEMEKVLVPLFQTFMDSDICIDSYEGWSFSMKFIKNSNVEYQFAVACLDVTRGIEKSGWLFAPSLKDRNESIWIFNDAAIVIHQESWLWFGE